MNITYLRLFRSLIIIAIPFLFSYCTKGSQKKAVIYQNDFESNNLNGISGGNIADFNNSKVIGTYNNGGFEIKLNKLAEHDLIEISFDLYIHDSWDGNARNSNGSGDPDIWEMKVDGGSNISTTFSNSPCKDVHCPPQSYPLNYLNSNNNPKKGAVATDLPGFCYWKDIPGGTSLYTISKTINHSGSNLTIQFRDALKKSGVNDPQCDESWSMDNITVNAVIFK